MGHNKRHIVAIFVVVAFCGMLLVAGPAIDTAHAQAFRLGDLSFPPPTGHVNDFAGVLRAQDKQALEGFLRNLDQKTGAQFALVTIPSLKGESRDDVAVRLFETWKIGRTDNRGLLLLDAINDRSMRIEVGYGLEGVLPDGLVGQFRDDYFTRHFKDRRQIGPEERFQAYVGLFFSMAQIVAEERGIDVKTLVDKPISTRRPTGRSRRGGWIPLIIFIVVYMAIFRRNPMLGMVLLMGMGGFGGRGRGGSGGFGGFGGGFGGFGGGMSGGGGAGGSY